MVPNSAPSGGPLSARSSLSKFINCPCREIENGWPTLTRRASHLRQNELGDYTLHREAERRITFLVRPNQLEGITEFPLHSLQPFP